MKQAYLFILFAFWIAGISGGFIANYELATNNLVLTSEIYTTIELREVADLVKPRLAIYANSDSYTPEDVISESNGEIRLKTPPLPVLSSPNASGSFGPGAKPTFSSATRIAGSLFLSLVLAGVGKFIGSRGLAIAALIGVVICVQASSPFVPKYQVILEHPPNFQFGQIKLTLSGGSFINTNTELVATSIDIQSLGTSGTSVDIRSATIDQSVTVNCDGDILFHDLKVLETTNVGLTSSNGGIHVHFRKGFEYAGTFELSYSSSLELPDDCAIVDSSHVSCFGSSTNHMALMASTDLIVRFSSYLWSDPATWDGGIVPTDYQYVTIPAGKTITLDCPTAALNNLAIQGRLIGDFGKDFALTATSIQVQAGGSFLIGSPVAKYDKNAVITLTGAKNGAVSGGDDGVSRGILVMGNLFLYGKTPEKVWTQLNDHAEAGATSLTLADEVQWPAGGNIVIAPTTFYGVSETDLRTLAQDTDGVTATIDSGLSYKRWGKIQWITDDGLSLSPGTFNTLRAHEKVSDQLDERPEVGLLTRHILIQGADDVEWTTNGWGVHIMAMGSGQLKLDGIEVHRAGQAGMLGRYPVHWHMMSYDPYGSYNKGNVTGQFVRNSAIWESANRATTIHGTCGATVENNVIYDIKTHAIFFEDGSEMFNYVLNNLVLRVRENPPNVTPIKVHDTIQYLGGGPSGLWLTNPYNTIYGNHFADCVSLGIWNSFAHQCFGLSKQVQLAPSAMPMLVHDFNTGHSNGFANMMTAFIVIDEAGNLGVFKHAPTANWGPVTSDNLAVPSLITRFHSWKGNRMGYFNQVLNPSYQGWVVADNGWIDFTGAVGVPTPAYAEFILGVGMSMNYEPPVPEAFPQRNMMASYHNQLNIRDSTIINYPAGPVVQTDFGFSTFKSSGVFDLSDLYITAYEKGFSRNSNLKMLNVSAGYRSPGPNIDGQVEPVGGQYRYYCFAGAIWDEQGLWTPPGHTWIIDMPFFTYGAQDLQPVEPAGINGVSTSSTFYGFAPFFSDYSTSAYYYLKSFRADRIDDQGNVVGSWEVGHGEQSTILGQMRHFAAMKGGSYVYNMPSDGPNRQVFAFIVTSCHQASDYFYVAVPWSRDVPPIAYASSNESPAYSANFIPTQNYINQGAARVIRAGYSITDVQNSADGTVFWHDTAAEKVWIKVVGGLVQLGDDIPDPHHDANLYRTYYYAVVPNY